MNNKHLKFSTYRLRTMQAPLRLKFQHSAYTHVQSNYLLIDLITTDGTSFSGEVQARSYLTGETLESAASFIEEMIMPRVMKADFANDEEARAVLEDLYLRADCSRFHASYCAVEWAILQAIAANSAKPMLELLRQIFPMPLRRSNDTQSKTGYSMAALPLLSSPRAECLALFLRSLGNRVIKAKISADSFTKPLQQFQRLQHIFQQVGFDANAGITSQDWFSNATSIRSHRPAFIEQPTPKDSESDWPNLAKATDSIIIADESLCSQSDAKRLLQNPGCGGWNLRLAKIGGFQGLQRLLTLAENRPLRLHLGSLVGETKILERAFNLAKQLYPFDLVEPPHSRWLLKHSSARPPTTGDSLS